jgi:hypothetical protein
MTGWPTFLKLTNYAGFAVHDRQLPNGRTPNGFSQTDRDRDGRWVPVTPHLTEKGLSDIASTSRDTPRNFTKKGVGRVADTGDAPHDGEGRSDDDARPEIGGYRILVLRESYLLLRVRAGTLVIE